MEDTLLGTNRGANQAQ